jgi:hypothetical protein
MHSHSLHMRRVTTAALFLEERLISHPVTCRGDLFERQNFLPMELPKKGL